jgi:hypothetical protein
MVLLATWGLPPLAAMQFMLLWTQLQIVKTVVVLRYAQSVERRQHLALSPGEQYRRHVSTGGYRP